MKWKAGECHEVSRGWSLVELWSSCVVDDSVTVVCMTPRQPVIISACYSGYQRVKSCFYKQTAGFNIPPPGSFRKGWCCLSDWASPLIFVMLPTAFIYERWTDAGGVETVFLVNSSRHSLYDALKEAYWIRRKKFRVFLHVCKVARD